MAPSDDNTMMPEKLWEHPNPESTQMSKFMKSVNQKRGLNMKTFQDLYDWSVGDQRNDFWADAWDTAGMIHEGSYKHVVEPNVRMDSIPKWFQGIRLNWAENMLYSSNPALKHDEDVAFTEVREGCTSIRDITWRELRQRVAQFASALRAHGVGRGDRIAVVAGNSRDTLAIWLATASVGGIFSSSSTDMGSKGILERLKQVRPRWCFVDEGALYNGQKVDLKGKMGEIVEGMHGVEEFEGIVSVPRWEEGKQVDVGKVPRTKSLGEFLGKGRVGEKLSFERVEFNEPFLIVYSSGTTGPPKCIVHGTGNVLLSAWKEQYLHKDWNENTVALQYTTTGWIMYLTAVHTLLTGGRAVLYDGSPFVPDASTFIKLVGEQKVTYLGISPRWLQTLVSLNLSPQRLTNLAHLTNVTSTGMVLSESLFRWFYSSAGFPSHVHLGNISGGTDLAGCFAIDNTLTPVYLGGCQGPSLGIKVAIYDGTVEGGVDGDGQVVKGRKVQNDEPGELVAEVAFVNMPVMFWPPGGEGRKKYRSAYFERFDDVWCHGDFIQRDTRTGQIVFLGRADGVLNPSGVRFGSAEIYSVIETQFAQEVLDSVCVGQRRVQDHDESVLLFLKMQPNVAYTSKLVSRIKDAIAKECSKRHVPRYIFETPEIPVTINNKKVELPIKHIVCGRTVKPSGTLANPESLQFYYQFARIEDVVGRGSKL